MMLQLLATFGCLALVTGAGAAIGAWLGRGHEDAPLGIGWSYLLGLAALGIVLHIPLAIDGRISHFSFATTLVGAAALIVAATLSGWFVYRRLRKQESWGWVFELPLAFRLVAVVTLLAAFGSAITMRPNTYDGRAAFGLSARVLYETGTIRNEDFEDVNRLHFNAHYPLLLSLLEAEIYWVQGSNDDGCIRAMFAMFVVALLSVVTGELRRYVGAKGAAAWGLCLLLLPMVITMFEGGGLSASADIPLACFLTAAVIEAGHWLRGHDPKRAATAGLMLGAACLMKAEGTIWIVALAIGLAWLLVRRAWRMNLSSLRSAASGVGILVVMVTLSVFARRTIPVSPYLREYTQALRWDWLVQVGERPLEIAEYTVEEFSNFGRWNLFWLCAVVGFVGLRRRYQASPEIRLAEAVTVCIAVAYFVIFVITPYHLHFQLRTALCRLALHFLPLLFLLLAERVQASGIIEDIVKNWRPLEDEAVDDGEETAASLSADLLTDEESVLVLSGRFPRLDNDTFDETGSERPDDDRDLSPTIATRTSAAPLHTVVRR